MTRVLVVSDVRLYRDAVAEILERRSEFEVAAVDSQPDRALGAVRAFRPALVLLDVVAPDALATARAIALGDGAVDTIALTVPDAEAEILACAEAGVSGYVSREGSVDDLLGAIHAALRGEFDCPARVTKSLARRLATLATGNGAGALARDPAGSAALTPRELEIAELIDRGLSNKEIARSLGVQPSTVKNHVHNILCKLNVQRRGEAAARLRSLFPLLVHASWSLPTLRR